MDFKILAEYFCSKVLRWWERLEVRKWINRQDPKVIIGAACVSVLILLVIIIVQLISGEDVKKIDEYKKEWFCDLNTGKLFTARSGLTTPIEAPSGPLPDGQKAGVKAYVFSYVSEPSESQRFVGFLEMADPNAEENGSVSVVSGAQLWGRGRLLRRVEDEQWYPANSEEGQEIFKGVFQANENGELPYYCLPK